MRYFRFGGKSMTAAILFGLFEELRLPHFRTLRENLHKEIEDNSAIRNKRLLSFLLEPRVRSECMFSAWNYDELVLDAVIEAVEQFTGSRGRQRGNVIEALRGKFAFQLVNACEKSSNHILIPTLYLDKADQCALLLYPGRTMDSYLVTKCRHIYIKSDLTARPTLSTDTLMSQEDSEICAVKGCQQAIELVFPEAMSRSVLPSRVHFDLVDSREKDTLRKYYRETATEPIKCQYCGVRNAPCQCSARCRICIECALVAYCSYGYSFRCPICAERLNKDLCMLLVDELPRRISWAPIPQPKANCDYCRQLVDIEGVREIPQAGKLTFACVKCTGKINKLHDSTPFSSFQPIGDFPVDFTLSPTSGSSAPYQHGRLSSELLSASTKNTLARPHQRSKSSPPRREADKNPPLGDFMESCRICGRLTSCYSVMKALKHGCWVCDDCIHAFYDPQLVPTCPICRMHISNSAFKAIQTWTNTLNSHSKMSISVLCCLCSQAKPLKYALKSTRFSHFCVICDECLLSSLQTASCPKCSQAYCRQDREIAGILKGWGKRQAEGEICTERVKKCLDCGRKVELSQPKCQNACLCSLCLLQNYVFSNSKKCPECSTLLKGHFPETLPCTGCGRLLIISEESRNTVAGVCENSCILCCFCIKIGGKQAKCAVCGANLETIEIRHIVKWQKDFKLGCYCGKNRGSTVKMHCGCKVHEKCRASLQSCRLCGRKYQTPQQLHRLNSYFT